MLPEPMPDKDIRQLAIWLLANQVVTLIDVPQHLAPMIFMPFALGGASNFTAEELGEIVVFGVLGEDETAGQLGGYPMFLECRVWLWDDLVKAVKVARSIHKAVENTPIPTDTKGN